MAEKTVTEAKAAVAAKTGSDEIETLIRAILKEIAQTGDKPVDTKR